MRLLCHVMRLWTLSPALSRQCMNLLVKEFHERHQQLIFVGMKRSIRSCWDGAGHADGRVSCQTVAEAERLIAGRC